ncbi:MAG: hybrid sensor histidine kinase/response regulator transcription factor [Chitinophagaceae bacterium]
MKRNSKLAQIFLLLLFHFGQPVRPWAQELRFKHIGINDGLPQSSVYCMFQDAKGFIWVGTTNGLSRYDGYAFRHFKFSQGNPHSINSNEMLCIGEDSLGNLLVGTPNGLNIYDPKTEYFKEAPLAKGNATETYRFVKTIIRTRNNIVWTGSSKGLLRFNAAKQVLETVRIPGTGSGSVTALFEAADGTLWIGIGRALVRWNPASNKIIPLPEELLTNPSYNKSSINKIVQDKAGNTWIATERNGLMVLDAKQQQVLNFESSGSKGRIMNDVVRDVVVKHPDVWVGTRNGVYVVGSDLTVKSNHHTDQFNPYSLAGNSVFCFMNDRAGGTWVGTFSGGISIYQPGNSNFSYIAEQLNSSPGLNYKVVSSIVEDRSGNLWIGTEGGGINKLEKATGRFRYIKLSPQPNNLVNQNMVKTLALDQEENLWAGTLEGLFHYHTKTGKIIRYPLAENPLAALEEQVYGLVADEAGVWAGTKSGLFHVDRSGKTARYKHQDNNPQSLVSSDINTLLGDSRGGLWIGTEGGLSYLRKGASAFVNFGNAFVEVFNRNGIIAVYEDKNGNIWVGTRGGGLKVFHRDTEQFYAVDERAGISGTIVRAITEDRSGNLWVSFDQSIARIVRHKKHPPFEANALEVTNYSVNNGLGSNEFLSGVCRTSSGKILFGGVNGILTFQPEKLFVNKIPPPVVFTDFLIKNIPVNIGEKNGPLKAAITYSKQITLSHDQAYFTIRFAALNYINSRTNQYAYRMEGLTGEKDWYYVGNQQSATYTNLPAGNYVFKVKAANNDGVWNEQPASLYIKVLPPIWKTWYAYLFYAAVITGLLYLFYSYSIKTSRLKNELLVEQLNHEKDQELIQRKLSFFTNISHEIKTPLTLMLAPIEKLVSTTRDNRMLNHLQLIQRNGERLLRLTDQLLDFRKFEEGNMQLQVTENDLVKFTGNVLQSFEGYAKYKSIHLQFQPTPASLNAWFDHDKLEKILFNLLSNAFKFTTPGDSITVTLETDATGEKAIIRVKDTGAGIASQNLEKIFDPFRHYNDTGRQVAGTGIGLAFSKGLAALHHGTVSVESRQQSMEEKGYSIFTVTIPIAQKAYSADETGAQQNTEASVEKTVFDQEKNTDSFAVETEPGNQPVMLVVEDNTEMRQFIADHFREFYQVHSAANGKEGWEMATELIPDIIISDVMMPDRNGTDLCRQLKTDQRTSHIPVILLTARTPLIFKIEGFETGADDYITKPFSVALLQIRVNNLLQSRKQLRERYSKDITLQPRNIAITSADEVFLEKVLKFIDDNIMEPTLNVEQLGKEVNMSRMTLYRKIKALTNQSVIEFIRSTRLKKAAQLLLRNEHTVNEVAYMVGFSDVDYFRKWFKTEFGVTPKEYKGQKPTE